MKESLLVRIEEAAKLLDLSRRQVRHLVRDGELPGFRVGRDFRLPRLGLEEWIVRCLERED
jgi:excisionase family DNA binding protein